MPDHDRRVDPAELGRHTRSLRGRLGSLRAAAEALAADAASEPESRRQLLAVVVEEAGRASAELEALALAVERRSGERRVAAEVDASELIEQLRAAVEASGVECVAPVEVPKVSVPGGDQTLVPALRTLFRGLRRETAFGACRLATRAVERHLLVDFAWEPLAPELPRLLAWQGEALGGEGSGGLRDALREHDGEAWFTLDRDGEAAHLRLLLPLSGEPALAAT